MPHKVTLLSLKESANREAVVKEILKLPHLTRGVVLNKLGKLPWELPEVSDALEENNWSDGLKNLGCELEVAPIEKGDAIESADYWPSEGLEEEEEVRSWDISRKEPGTPSEQLYAAATITPRARRSKLPRNLWWILPVILLFLVLGYWRFKGEKDSSRKIARDWNRQTERNLPADRGAWTGTRSGSPPSATSGSRQAPPPKLNISQVKKTLRRDPGNTLAWSSWIDTLERAGQWDKANVVRRLYMAKSGKVEKDLDSLVTGQGLSLRDRKVTPREIRLSIGLPPVSSPSVETSSPLANTSSPLAGDLPGNPLQRGYFFYKELRKLHGDKRITTEVRTSSGETYSYSVPRSRKTLTWVQFKEYLRM